MLKDENYCTVLVLALLLWFITEWVSNRSGTIIDYNKLMIRGQSHPLHLLSSFWRENRQKSAGSTFRRCRLLDGHDDGAPSNVTKPRLLTS